MEHMCIIMYPPVSFIKHNQTVMISSRKIWWYKMAAFAFFKVSWCKLLPVGLSPLPSNSHQQDYFIFSRGSLTINLHLPLLLGGATKWCSRNSKKNDHPIFLNLKPYFKISNPFNMQLLVSLHLRGAEIIEQPLKLHRRRPQTVYSKQI